MTTIWDEEEKKRKQMMGAPLATVSVESPTPVNPNIQEQKGPPGVATTAQNIMVNRALNQGLDYGIKKTGEGIDKAKEIFNTQPTTNAPLSATPAVAPAEIAGATPANQAALNLTENTPVGDVTSGMVDSSAPLATDVASNVAENAAESAIEGSASSVAGPLAGAITLAKTGDAGKAAGATAGTMIGGALGSAFGPIGTFVGSAIGPYAGQQLGGYLT